MGKDEKIINMAIPMELHKKLKMKAARMETTVKQLVIDAIAGSVVDEGNFDLFKGIPEPH